MLVAVLVLLPFTALALGAVHVQAFAAMEIVIFGAGAAWMGRVALGLEPWTCAEGTLPWLVAAVLAMPVLIIAQLLPLPPALLARAAPGSYAAYRAGLPGWPGRAAYSWISQASELGSSRYWLPTSNEVSDGALVPFIAARPAVVADALAGVKAGAWRPVSAAPRLTGPALLKLIAYAAVFLFLGFAPLATEEERHLAPAFIRMVVITGLAVSLVGLAEQVHSNGKPLWLFSPYEWRLGSPWGVRVYGPFANPDHYADYLAMVWPFALACVLLPGAAGEVKERMAVPILAGTIGVTILAALIVTGSRGGWLAVAAATTTVLGLIRSRPLRQRPRWLASSRSRTGVLTLGAGVTASLCLVLAFTGTSSRTEADQRFASVMNSGSLAARSLPSRDSLAMIADSPLVGIGLGAWPELYPKYASAPWTRQYMNAAHNDYVQWLAETGIAGLLLAAAVLYLAAVRIKRGLPGLSSQRFPAVAACAGAVAAIAAHSLFDFPLRIPANALLATVCAGMMVRLCSAQARGPEGSPRPMIAARMVAVVIMTALLGAIAAALIQPPVPYPFDLPPSGSISEAIAQIKKYPTQARLHLALAAMFGNGRGAAIRSEEIKAALQLEPHNPLAQDLYALDLASIGQRPAALEEMEQSVFDAPEQQSHFYLTGRFFAWLSSDEYGAIERGLRRAVTAKYAPATVTLTQFYHTLGRFGEEADLLIKEADGASSDDERAVILNRAGFAYLAAQEPNRATEAFKLAIAGDPVNPDAYRNLAIGIYGQRGAFDQARQILDEGLANGAPAVPLYLALADLERNHNDLAGAEQTLEGAAIEAPGTVELDRSLGDLYFIDGKFDRSAIWYRKASQIAPQSADTYFALGRAEEAGYQYSAADHDLAEAAALNGGAQDYRGYYAGFKKKVADAKTH